MCEEGDSNANLESFRLSKGCGFFMTAALPVIAVFTKYDQFLRNVKMDVLDYSDKYLNKSVSEVAKEQFEEHYLHPLGEDVGYVQLESEL